LAIFSARTVGFVATILFTLFVMVTPASTKGLSLVRDSEIENTILSYSAPLFTVAGLDASAVNVHIINDSRINAFVTGGLNLFVNAGLLMSGENPGPIVGVIAHETGHLAGGHLARTQEAVKNATTESIIAYVLGAAAILSGRSDAAEAIIGTGNAVAQQSFIRYSQTQERSADQAAVRYLEATGRSAEGLLDLFHQLEDQELLIAERQDPYIRSHPLTRDRIHFVENFISNAKYHVKPWSDEELLAHRRMVAKLFAFIYPPSKTLRIYHEGDKSLKARYARAIAYFRIPDLEKAIAEINSLISEQPEDPWFLELKGQMLFENGHIALSIPPYERAVGFRPEEALLRLGLARALIEMNETECNEKAIEHLIAATQFEPHYAEHWHFLGIAYGRNGQLPQSSLALAEASLLSGNLVEAEYHAEKAKRGLKVGSPSYLRAEDIALSAKHNNH